MLAAGDVRFGSLKIEEKSVAFVADGSRWTKNKLPELCDELMFAVNAMSADQRFSIIFFADDQTTAFAGGELVPARDANKDKLKEWLKDVRLGDKSTPISALTRAFELKPDAVVFISDGKFEDYDGVESRVGSMNPERKVHLHAVGFFHDEKEDDSRSFAAFMKRLAERNNGKSAFVYADELKRRKP